LAERLGFVIRYMLSYNKISIVTTSLSYTRRDYPNFDEQSARIPHLSGRGGIRSGKS